MTQLRITNCDAPGCSEQIAASYNCDADEPHWVLAKLPKDESAPTLHFCDLECVLSWVEAMRKKA